MSNKARLRHFVTGMSDLADEFDGGEKAMVGGAKSVLADLVSKDEWRPGEYAVDDKTYRQYLLHSDPQQRFSVVSLVRGLGQRTPIYDHTVWGLIGMIRGAENGARFKIAEEGSLVSGDTERLEPGDVDIVSSVFGDIHQVSNASKDRKSISADLTGANMGAVDRYVYDSRNGPRKNFISGYANNPTPNLWGLSR